MSVYKFTKFRDEILPRYDPQRQLGPAPALPAVQMGFAGPFDGLAYSVAPPALRMIEFTGTYIGDPDAALLDESGAILTDESDDPLTVDRSVSRQVERLTRLRGHSGDLERQDLLNGDLHYLTARLLSVDFQTAVGDATRIATVSPRFEAAQTNWRSAARTSLEGTLDMSTANPHVVGQNDGLLAATQAIVSLTFSRRGATFRLHGENGGQAWHWELVFDATDPASGAWGIEADDQLLIAGPAGVATPYTRFSLGEGHSVRALIWLAPGAFRIEASEEVDSTNTGGGTVQISTDFFTEYP